jgi:hypothetical protein
MGNERVRKVTVVVPVRDKETRMIIGRAFEREDGSLDVYLDVADRWTRYKIENPDVEVD